MSKIYRLYLVPLLLLSAALFLNACSSGWTELTKEEKAKGSLLYLYIDTDDMAGHLDRVVFKQVKPGEAPKYYGCAIKKERYIWFEGLPKGKYMLDNYGGMNGVNFLWMRWGADTNYTYNFPVQGAGFEISDQKVYYLGAFKHVRIKGKGFFSRDKFDIEPIKSMKAKEVFPTVLKNLKGSPLQDMAERYSARL
jgi:hypothetical protein